MLSRKQMIDIMLGADDSTPTGRKNHLLKTMVEEVGDSEFIRQTLRNFLSKLEILAKKYKKSLEMVLEREGNWCGFIYDFTQNEPGQSKPLGRPSVLHSGRAQERTRKELRTSFSIEDLASSLATALTLAGHRKAARMIKKIALNPEVCHEYKLLPKERIVDSGRLSGTTALAMFAEADLSKSQYNIVKRYVGQSLPNYNIILEEKKKCYPPEEATLVTEVSAEHNLQDLVDLTVRRLILAEDIQAPPEGRGFDFFWKWGMDGSSGLSNYNCKYRDGNTETHARAADSGVFMVTCVPLRLLVADADPNNPMVIWKNPKPSSALSCRVVKFEFRKESTKTIIDTAHQYKSQFLGSLLPTNCIKNGVEFEVRHTGVLTMVDGKVCNALTDNACTQKCYICGLMMKDFNDPEKVKLASSHINSEAYNLGLSTLHAEIRTFEFLLHLGYKSEIKTWVVKEDDAKAKILKRKKMIQDMFWEEQGLIVDMPTTGFGSSNTGNTARRFFTNCSHSASILNISTDIVYKFGVVLEVIKSRYPMDVVKFRDYCLSLYHEYLMEYSWLPLTPTVHKILIHGPFIIENFLVPIGILSEEAQEARHKHFKKYRRNFSRMLSRADSNRDIMNRLTLTSDPVLISNRIQLVPDEEHRTDVLELLQI